MSFTNSIVVFADDKVEAALDKNPNDVLFIEKKKKNKEYTGTVFYNCSLKVDGKKSAGYISFNKDIPLTKGVADPANKDDQRTKFPGTRLNVETSLSRAGCVGRVLEKMTPSYNAQVTKMIEAGDMEEKPIHPLMQTHYSTKKDVPVEYRGKPIPDPKIRFKLDFKPYPANFPNKTLAGQPKTQILDWSTRKIIVEKDGKAREEFSAAVVLVDGTEDQYEPVGELNVHKFITPGSVLKRGRLQLNSANCNAQCVSLPIIASKLVIQKGAEEGWQEDNEISLDDISGDFPGEDEPTTQTVNNGQKTDDGEIDNIVNSLTI